MKLILKYFCVFVLLGFFGLNSSAQTLKAYIVAAENAFAERDFFTAYTLFETALSIDSSQLGLHYKLATAARLYHAYTEAEKRYYGVYNHSDNTLYPDAPFWLGKVQAIQGKYDDAIAHYEVYLSEQADVDSVLTAEARYGVAGAKWAKENLQNIDDTTSVALLGADINTQYSEFGAIDREGDMYFTRLGYERIAMEKKRRYPPSLLFSKVLVMSEDSAAIPLDSTLNDPQLHTAYTAFNTDGSRVYYTLCEYLNKSDVRCDLHYRDIDGDKWGEAQILPEPINLPGYTSTQPHVGFDEQLGKEVLYFSSNRPGGTGKLDIWYSVVNDANSFTEPRNASQVNTYADEVTPFWHAESNTLYFSSDNHVGFGGYDIFRAKQTGSGWATPVNIGPAINSSYNDVHFTFAPDESKGHYSSNRTKSQYLEASREACCYDVYEVKIEPVNVNLMVTTLNARTLEPLPRVEIYLVRTNGDYLEAFYNSGDTSMLTLPLRRNKHYMLVGALDGFDPDTIRVSTYDILESRDIHRELKLQPQESVLEIRVFDLRQEQPLVNVLVEVEDAETKHVDTDRNPNGHIYHFPIRSGIGYKITGSRKGYRTATEIVTGTEAGSRDTLIKNIYLDLGNLEDFLPLAIYFDNDRPDPRSRKPSTSKRYLETYEPYYGSKDRFKRRYARGLSDADAITADGQIETFFESNLRKGKEEFDIFMNILNQYLDEGLTFKIYLKGYASPLAAASYNQILGQRRIHSIQNEFGAYRGGVLSRYISSGDLEVTERSFGEGTAPTDVSDDYLNPRKSVYSPEASGERRVEIIEIERDRPPN